MSKLVLATGNQGKVKEMASLLADFGFDVVAQSDYNVSSVAETGTTFIENAIIKARHAAKETGLPAIADDSGLEVDYLKGAPGSTLPALQALMPLMKKTCRSYLKKWKALRMSSVPPASTAYWS